MNFSSKAQADLELAVLGSANLESADLELIVATIANSPIVARPAPLAALLADWENTRKSPDVDGIVLAWIASHVSHRKPTSLS